MARMPWLAAVAALFALALFPNIAVAKTSNANVAALQVALRALHHYSGQVDGLAGPLTKRAVRRFQRAHRLQVDGVAGPRTRRALGRRGRPLLGSRIMKRGHRGWDVAALQFMLRRRGFSPGGVDGGFGVNTLRAVKRLQGWAGIGVDGRVGRQTLSVIRSGRRRSSTRRGNSGSSGTPSGPVRFLRPVRGPMGDGFGYPGGRRHDGIDFPVPYGTPVGAAGVGVVTFAGWNSGGYGNLMVVRHRLGYETWYAHLSSFSVRSGASVAGGVQIARVGSTGRSTGPHLHWEVRHNGVPINPVPMMLGSTSLKLLLPADHGDHDCEPGGTEVTVPAGPVDPATARLQAC